MTKTNLSERIKILFILPSLRPGGAERVISIISQSIDKSLFEPTLLVIGFDKDNSYSTSNVATIYLNKPRVLNSIYSLYKQIQKNKPKIVMSSIGHVNIIMGTFSFLFPETKFVAREASIEGVMQKFNKKTTFLPKWLIQLIYNQLDMIICQSDDMSKDLISKYNLLSNKVITINNPISIEAKIKPKCTLTGNTVTKFITIGRLSKEKGHIRVLQALSQFKKPFHYTIIGDGPEKNNIIDKATELNIRDNITHIPYTKEVAVHLIQNDFFLQGSFVEGFPNSLLESCTVGVPAVVFAAPGGTKEIVVDGVNGFIAIDHEDFLNKLNEILLLEWNPNLVSSSVTERFGKKKIISEYENLFLSVIRSNIPK